MATGSIETGRWMAHRIVPPTAALPGGALTPGAWLPAAVGATLAVPGPQAAITAPMAGSDRPMTDARWMNCRRVMRPLAYASTTSSSSGVADRRTRSRRLKSMSALLLDHATDRSPFNAPLHPAARSTQIHAPET